MNCPVPELPDVRDLAVRDTAEGVFVDFRLEEGIDTVETDSYTQMLWVRAKVYGSDFYQPVSSFEILPGGKTATACVANKCVIRDGDTCSVEVEWYFERYPKDYNEETFSERQKGPIVKRTLSFTSDWFGMSKWDHDTRVGFETRGMDHQISEARRYERFSQERDYGFEERGLSLDTGLWMTHDRPNGKPIAISYEQPDMGQPWLRAWIDGILAALGNDA